MVIYPIRDNVDARGRQLVNWVAEIATPKHKARDWNRPGELDDFIGAYADWHFDWLDVPAMIRSTEKILEFPMIDQDPLPWWSQRARDAAGRCRASDVSARLERRGAGDPRCACADAMPSLARGDPVQALEGLRSGAAAGDREHRAS